MTTYNLTVSLQDILQQAAPNCRVAIKLLHAGINGDSLVLPNTRLEQITDDTGVTVFALPANDAYSRYEVKITSDSGRKMLDGYFSMPANDVALADIIVFTWQLASDVTAITNAVADAAQSAADAAQDKADAQAAAAAAEAALAAMPTNPLLPKQPWSIGAKFDGALTASSDYYGMNVTVDSAKRIATFHSIDGTAAGGASSLTRKSSGKWYACFRFNASALPVAGIYAAIGGFCDSTFDAHNAVTTFNGHFVGLIIQCAAVSLWTFQGSSTTSPGNSTALVDGDTWLVCIDLDANTFGVVTPDNVYHAGLQSTIGTLTAPVLPVAMLESSSAYPATITLVKGSGGLTAPSGYQNIAGNP